MKLTNAEKLMILLLCDVRDGTKECDTDLIRTAIINDETWGIPWKMSGVAWDREPVPDYVTETADILDMFSFLEASYDALDKAGKAKVDAAEMAHSRRYRGFDGNNETEYFSCVMFMVSKLHMFTDLADRYNLNSHGPTLEIYRRMLAVWRPMREGGVIVNTLSADQIIQVIAAARYPG